MGLFSVQSFMPELMSYLRNVLPADALSMVERFLTQVAEGSGANILSLGALGALWASSSGVMAIMECAERRVRCEGGLAPVLASSDSSPFF